MNPTTPFKQISAILPDDESLLHELIHGLKEELGILSLDHHTCRGVGAIGKRNTGRRFRTPPAKALRMLSVLVEPSRADAVFDYIFDKADVNRPMGGIVYMGPLDGATAFLMPEGIQDEDK